MSRCIWYISKYVAPPDRANAGGRGYLLMREMARLGHRCVIVASDSNNLAEVPSLDQPYLLQVVDGMHFCWVRTLKYTLAKSVSRILSWLDFEFRLWCMPKGDLPKPDVIVVSSLSLLTIFNGVFLRSRYRARLVLEIRDIWPLTITEEGGFSPHNPFVLGLAWVEKYAYRHADAIVGTMPNLQAHVERVLGEAKEVHCIPMGVDQNWLSVSSDLPLGYARQYIPDGKLIVGHVGSIGITNALDVFFECAERMIDCSEVHFLVVGDGDLRSVYQGKFGHLPNLTFAPRVQKTMVQAVLACCDVVYFSVHPSKVWDFGQSLNKLIDYMLAGKPIIASYTGYPSMIDEAGCGSFIPAGDCAALCEELLRYASMSDGDREVLGQRGREWILENRMYSKLAKDYLNILFPRERALV